MLPLNIALIGFGWFAELLVTRVLANVPALRVVAVVDPSAERRARAQELGLSATDSISTLASVAPLCQAVVVLTPHDTHRRLVELAATAGLHVFCEKAFAVTSADCLAMVQACNQAGVVLAVGHMQKLFPGHARLVALCRSGQYGKVVAAQVTGLHWCPVLPGWWRSRASCGGLLYWTGIHDIDTLRAAVGSDVQSAFAVTGTQTDDYTEYENSIAVTLMYGNGAIATMQVAEHDPLNTFEESFEYSVLLEKGSIRLKPFTGELRHAGRIGNERNSEITEQYGSFASQEEHAYRQELLEFVDLVQAGAASTGLSASALDGLRCVETLEAIYRSAASRKPETVELHWPVLPSTLPK
jgi:predicted dehydrogenase